MSGKARNITRLVNSATTFTYSDRTAKTLARTAATTTSTSAANDVTLANYIRFTPDSSSSLSKTSVKPLSELTVESIRVNTSSIDDVDVKPESEEDDYQQPLVNLLELRWHKTVSNSVAHLNRKEVSRDRKQLWVFKSTQSNRFGRLVKMCAEKLGANATLEVFRKLDRETGVKEFNFMIEHCIEKARNAVDEDAALEEFHRAYVLFEIMRERGFKIGEETYGPFLLFVIDMGMVEEFHFYCDHIKKDNPKSLQRLAYYEMLLWIKVGDEDKIQKLIGDTLDTDDSNFNGMYLISMNILFKLAYLNFFSVHKFELCDYNNQVLISLLHCKYMPIGLYIAQLLHDILSCISCVII
ncbi:hypothetical protein HanLR1_Chr05g0192001 [Helianthus annuus]|nr:hypothetical protein HanLR1_Chr05g0192001 [Helianthus annuus]